ncbi:hypothetical protein ES702_05803 [subsurface metagenome]
MDIPIFKIFMIFGIVSNWAQKALADRVMTLDEGVVLLKELCSVLGVRTELEIPAGISTLVPDTEETEHPTGDEATLERERPPPR